MVIIKFWNGPPIGQIFLWLSHQPFFVPSFSHYEGWSPSSFFPFIVWNFAGPHWPQAKFLPRSLHIEYSNYSKKFKKFKKIQKNSKNSKFVSIVDSLYVWESNDFFARTRKKAHRYFPKWCPARIPRLKMRVINPVFFSSSHWYNTQSFETKLRIRADPSAVYSRCWLLEAYRKYRKTLQYWDRVIRIGLNMSFREE